MSSDPNGAAAIPAANSTAHGRLGLLGLLFVQAIIGYEWLISGLAKMFGDFACTFERLATGGLQERAELVQDRSALNRHARPDRGPASHC